MNKNNELTEFAKDVLSSTPSSVTPLQRKIFGDELSDFTLRLANAVKRGEELKIAGYEKTYFGADKIAAILSGLGVREEKVETCNVQEKDVNQIGEDVALNIKKSKVSRSKVWFYIFIPLNIGLAFFGCLNKNYSSVVAHTILSEPTLFFGEYPNLLWVIFCEVLGAFLATNIMALGLVFLFHKLISPEKRMPVVMVLSAIFLVIFGWYKYVPPS